MPANRGGDNLAYVTPIWVDDLADISPRLATLAASKNLSDWSHLYLPLRPGLRDGEIAKEFALLVQEPSFRYVLLNMPNISSITVVDNRLNGQTTQLGVAQEGSFSSVPQQNLFLEHRMRQVRLTCGQRLSKADENEPFVNVIDEALSVHEFKIEIPDVIRRNEATRSTVKQSCVRFAFPGPSAKSNTPQSHAPAEGSEVTSPLPPRTVMERSISTTSLGSASQFSMDADPRNRCYVYATLPMCDAGLRFVLNANWVTTTSRANVVQASQFNQHLRNSAARLFVHALLCDDVVKHQLGTFLPRPQYMPSWWSTFGDEVSDLVTKRRLELFGTGNRICNRELQSTLWVSEEDLLKFADIQVLQAENLLGLTDEALEGLGLEKVGVRDVLACLETPAFLEGIFSRNAMPMASKRGRDEMIQEWWCRLFHILSNECDTMGKEERQALVNAVLHAPVFSLVKHLPGGDWRLLGTMPGFIEAVPNIKPRRQHIPALTDGRRRRNVYLLTKEGPALRFTWRWQHQIALVAHSVEERSFLTRHLRINQDKEKPTKPFAVVNLTRKALLDSIRRIHIEAKDGKVVGTAEQILCDLQVVRQNWNLWAGSPLTRGSTHLLYLPFCEDKIHRQAAWMFGVWGVLVTRFL